ncbi:MAG: DNA (cytosine-5-)-methyltransferase [Gemmatimonadetes bacterium]|nr:DNA (cytosine-5-)-methyltransferase [Gemmatimonadota bacterium]
MSRRSKSETSDFRQLRVSSGLTQAELASLSGFNVREVKRWEAGDASPRAGVWELLRARLANQARASAAGDFTFIDLFAGIGGLRLGFEAAGGKCVFTSEWDTYSQKTYKANFGNDEIHGDITQIDAREVPDHDVLLAGFPCQPFSLAGVSKKNALGRPHGFACETQGTLFFDVERIIAEKQPKAFLLENVKHLVNHDGGRTFAVIQQVLKEKLGYYVFPKLIDGRQFVPQHRERIYLVGFREDVAFSWDEIAWPAGETGPLWGPFCIPRTVPKRVRRLSPTRKGRLIRSTRLVTNYGSISKPMLPSSKQWATALGLAWLDLKMSPEPSQPATTRTAPRF